jgi:hypothetical protein
MILPDDDIPFRIRFSIAGLPDAEGGWTFPNLEEAQNMAHFTLRQALLGQSEPSGVAQIFDFEGNRLGYLSAIIADNNEHWAWKAEAFQNNRPH